MGPRPIGRGNTGPAPGHARAVYASMGPRPIGRGNSPLWARRGIPMAKLQWGRDRSVAEILPLLRRRRPPRRFNGAATDRSRKCANTARARRRPAVASMGPRPIGRGNHSEARRAAARGLASMGPRPIGRGNVRIPRGRGGAPPWLQWGRDRSVAEILPRWPEGEPAIALQWGRDRSVAEIRTDQGTGRRPAPGASMGPRPIGRGNLCLAGHHPPVDHGFNGAATDRSRKSGITESPYLEAVWASMGPRPIGRGNLGRGV